MKSLFLGCFILLSLALFGQSGHNWMTNLPYGTKLSELSIPGTHDAAAIRYKHHTGLAKPYADAQRESIESQLDYGVRFLDIRIGEFNGHRGRKRYRVAHGSYRYKYTLQDILTKVRTFLRNNRGEVVIISLKVENASGSKDVRIRNHCNSVILANQFYSNGDRCINDPYGYTPSIHQLGWARGQIIILDRNGFGPHDSNGNRKKIGIRAFGWGDNSPNRTAGDYLQLQDSYSGLSYSTKRSRIRTMRDHARNTYGSRITLNFASMIWAPRTPLHAANAINPGIKSHYNSTNNRERCILIVDFASRDLVESIWKNNFNGSTYVPRLAGPDDRALTEVRDREATDGAFEKNTTTSITNTTTLPALHLGVAPNPASGPFALMIDHVQNAGLSEVTICDLQGRVVWRQEAYLTAGQSILEVDGTPFSPGLFIVQVTTEHGARSTTKFVYR